MRVGALTFWKVTVWTRLKITLNDYQIEIKILLSGKSYGALKFATAVFFEMSKGLVIIYVEKGWGGERGGGGGRRREKYVWKIKIPSFQAM